MIRSAAIATTLMLCLAPLALADEDLVPVVVMEFSSRKGVSQERMDALSDLLTAQIVSLGRFRVIGKNDIKSALKLENQRTLLGCDDTSCVAELGGALGARWVVVGDVSSFDKSYLMNLRLLDAEKVRVAAAVARKIEGAENAEKEEAIIDVLAGAVKELFTRASDATGVKPHGWKGPMRPLEIWGHVALWSGVGCLALGGVGVGLAKKYGDDYDGGDLSAKGKSVTWNGVMWAGFGAGAALVTTGVVLWVIDYKDPGLMLAGAPTSDGGFVFGLSGRW